jgi:type VI secretion system protein ImpC
MSEAQNEAQSTSSAEVQEKTGPSLLEQAISATKQTERSRTEELLKTLTEEALRGTVTFSKNLTKTLTDAIAAIDAKLSQQLAAIMHTPEFVKLEGSWRGLRHLVFESETSASLKIKVLNVGKRDLFKDLDRAVEFKIATRLIRSGAD